MDFVVEKSTLNGAVQIPGSKSHTIRAVAIAALAEGTSRIFSPLDSADAHASRRVYRQFGARIEELEGEWRVQGLGGNPSPPEDIIDVRNSGTTMRVALGSAALMTGSGLAVLTGDEQVRRRPCGPLAAALTALGARVESCLGTGNPPFVVRGRIRGGEATIEAVTSQYVSALLINAPLAEGDTVLHVPLLNEKPYVMMTLDWLARQGVRVDHDSGLSEFRIPGGQRYRPVNRPIPADFSSATFFLAAGALSGNRVGCRGLDMSDTQGDKAVVDYLRAMGASVQVEADAVVVEGGALRGCEIDMNATPDALPMMAVLACFAEGTTRLTNVPQARLKETDRIHVMRTELEKMGASVTELPDGMVIEKSALHNADVEGHGDHRVIMALSIAATQVAGATTIHGADAVDVTYPGFAHDLRGLGGLLG
jgi:3-phosphoshikimate 1-carboxyvinyltransferase